MQNFKDSAHLKIPDHEQNPLSGSLPSDKHRLY